jgi:hypothetical protein
MSENAGSSTAAEAAGAALRLPRVTTGLGSQRRLETEFSPRRLVVRFAPMQEAGSGEAEGLAVQKSQHLLTLPQPCRPPGRHHAGADLDGSACTTRPRSNAETVSGLASTANASRWRPPADSRRYAVLERGICA